MKSHDDKPDNDIDNAPQATINLSTLITAALKATQWAEKMTQFAVPIQQLAENIADQILLSERFAEYFQELKGLPEKLRVTDAETARILNKYKWPVSPSMPFRFMFKVIELHRQGGNQRGAINKLFVDYFSANEYEQLSALIETWKSNPLFEPRMKIFRDCVAALKQADGRYNASNIVLPTLIAQIDGILMKYMEQKQIDRWVVTQKGEVKPDRQWKSKLRAQIANQYSSNLLLLTSDILLDVLFQRAFYGQPLKVPFTFSRHKVMHGEYTRYGRIDNTLRAFLILDFLSGLQ
jgi:hypothetical protein